MHHSGYTAGSDESGAYTISERVKSVGSNDERDKVLEVVLKSFTTYTCFSDRKSINVYHSERNHAWIRLIPE